MDRRLMLLAVAGLGNLWTYLWVSAPPPLQDDGGRDGKIPIERVLPILDGENAAARALYSEEIVRQGKLSGLAFDERWRDKGSVSGPLPALLLRETAAVLARRGSKLGLFLGSDYPISAANRVSDSERRALEQMRRDRQPRFFFDEETRRHVAMFPDLATSEACVTCHNAHPNSPKKNWHVGDVMGATTWTYPERASSAAEALALVTEVRESIGAAYGAYLAKVEDFPQPRPEVGERWPRDGYFLPSGAAFTQRLLRETSPNTLHALLGASGRREGE